MTEPKKARMNGWTIAALIKDVPVPEKHAGTLRTKQLELVRRMTFIMVLTNLLNATVVLLSFRNTPVDSLLHIWGAAIVVAGGFAVGHQILNSKPNSCAA